MIPTRCGHWLVLSLLPSLALAQLREEELLSMPLEELGKLEVNIATGTPHTLSEAPAVTTVITAQDIEAMGAQTLNEALAAVPGLHINNAGLQGTSRYFIRGISSKSNPETLILINGVPQTSLWLADRGLHWQGVPVTTIARIEVIRGPGSAVYGADAFAGVINIITKSPEDLVTNQGGLSLGSNDTTRAALAQKAQFGDLHAALFLNVGDTAGDASLVRSDAQSNIDALHLSPPVSYAPGPVERGYNDADARLELDWGLWRLRANWQQLWHAHDEVGVVGSLDPSGLLGYSFGDLDVGWHDPNWSPNWDLAAQISYSYKSQHDENANQLYPPGAFFGSFPQGVLEKVDVNEENARIDLTAIYNGWSTHRLRLGSGFSWDDIYHTRDIKNFDASQAPLIRPLPGGMTDVSGTPMVFLPTAQRTDASALVQDEWTLAPHWQVTAGLRHDQYSDFGGTTNPRAALVWQTTPRLTSKLLYGQAFRAPSFSELYVTNNPLVEGNPHLRPEKLKSVELAFAWRPDPMWSLDLNLYQLRINDFIEYVSTPPSTELVAANTGDFDGEGMEMETRWQPAKTLQLLVNYSHQHTYDVHTGAPPGQTPRDQAYARMTWNFAPSWQITPQLTWVGSTARAAGDPRDALHGSTTLALTLRRQFPHGVDVALIGRNLGNADVREATIGPISGQTMPPIPYDLPEAGRTITVEIQARW